MNDAALNTHVQVIALSYVFISFGYVPRSGISGSYGNSVFNLFFFLNEFIYLFIFGCIGSSLLHVCFL